MSKKVVPFVVPPKPRSEAASADAATLQHEEPDKWIFNSEPPPTPEPLTNHVVIDLSANRTWFELAGLICAFPYIATWCWMQNAAGIWFTSFKQH